MDTTTEELIETLDELAQILESDDAHHWGSWMRSAATRLKNGDFSGVDQLLRAYGGMGSLNDLILGQTTHDGAFAWKLGHLDLNERFDSLRSKACQLAQHIRRSHGASD